jgi:hypothetical protein
VQRDSEEEEEAEGDIKVLKRKANFAKTISIPKN